MQLQVFSLGNWEVGLRPLSTANLSRKHPQCTKRHAPNPLQPNQLLPNGKFSVHFSLTLRYSDKDRVVSGGIQWYPDSNHYSLQLGQNHNNQKKDREVSLPVVMSLLARAGYSDVCATRVMSK